MIDLEVNLIFCVHWKKTKCSNAFVRMRLASFGSPMRAHKMQMAASKAKIVHRGGCDLGIYNP